MKSSNEKILSFLIADLAGYTAFTEAHGDRAAADVVNQFLELIMNSLSGTAKFIERAGDEVLILAEEPEDLLKTAINMSSLADEKANFPALHIGLHKGNIFEKDGYFYGSTLNLTSRIANYSREGQILCSAEFKAALDETESENFKSMGHIRFKNYSKPLELFEIMQPATAVLKETDPVCKMQLTAEQAPAKLPYSDSTYYFCSLKCAQAFASDPLSYIFIEKTSSADQLLE